MSNPPQQEAHQPSPAAQRAQPFGFGNAVSVGIVGGGLAGVAAAVALAERGIAVELFEQRKMLGGRVGAFREPRTGQMLDHSQHVSMGCCTNLSDFCRRIGIADRFHRHRTLHFLAPDRRQYDFHPAAWLPAPLHLGPALMRLGYLSLGQRGSIAAAMNRLVRERPTNGNAQQSIGEWLRRHGQSDRTIEQFWSVVLLAALSETVDRIAVPTARKVFFDGMLAHREAYELAVPEGSLGEAVDQAAADWLSGLGVRVHRGCRVERLEGDGEQIRGVRLADGSTREFAFVIAAVPWHKLPRLLPESVGTAVPAIDRCGDLPRGAITAVHLWFDRPVTPLPHAALVDRYSQWFFQPGRQDAIGPGGELGHYCQAVISATHAMASRSRQETVDEVCRDLEAVWPSAGRRRLLHARVVTHPSAVFAPQPGVDALRPPQSTAVENLLLAGDWTATGWPATMEGAVRSGYLAAEAILNKLGHDDRVLVPDLPTSRLARWLVR